MKHYRKWLSTKLILDQHEKYRVTKLGRSRMAGGDYTVACQGAQTSTRGRPSKPIERLSIHLQARHRAFSNLRLIWQIQSRRNLLLATDHCKLHSETML